MAPSKDSFVHLHVHSEYSMLDGAARVKPLIDAAVEQGMPAIAMTDHGNMFGAYDFWHVATAAGIKPIIGTEAYITPGTARQDRTRVRWGNGGEDDVSGSGSYTHMTLLAENNVGMHNLFKMSSLASIEGFYFKPRMDRELLSTYAEGVIGTTGCAGNCSGPTAVGFSDPPDAPVARSRPGCGSASTILLARPRGSFATSSAPRTSTAKSWTTASTSSAG